MTPLAFLGLCAAATPVVIALATAATTVWYERRFLPSIAGED